MAAARKKRKKTLYLVDGSGYIFRAFYAIRSLTTSEGFPTNAIYGFTQMVVRLVEDEQPDYLAVVFDPPGPSFRRELYADYKANRPPKPEDLVPQLPLVRDVVRAFNIPSLEVEGFEADDVIATLATRAESEDVTTVIVSSDKDLMQLVGDECVLLDTMKNVRYDAAAVEDKLGVQPDKVLDLLALMGDSSDNIPGVPGIGPKTATKLLDQFGSLDGLYERVSEVKGKRREKLEAHKEDALLSRRLADLRRDVPLDVTLEDLARKEPDRPALTKLFGELEFKAWQREYHAGVTDEDKPIALSHDGFALVRDEAGLEAMMEALRGAERVGVAVMTTEPHPVAARLVGLSLAADVERAYYVPLGHSTLDAGMQLPRAKVFEALAPLLADPGKPKAIIDYKYALQVLRRLELPVAGEVFDPMLASYLLDAGQYAQTLSNMAISWLDHKAIAYKDVGGSGKKAKRPDEVPADVLMPFACEAAQLALALERVLSPRLEVEELRKLYDDMELPLTLVLADMEAAGVAIDVPRMKGLSAELGGRVRELEAEAHEAAGREFAVGSTKQLAEVLFNELGLPPVKKTKTGYSTDSSVLEELADKHPLPKLVLEWRQLSKLKSTYTDVLPTLVRPETGRIHTIFNQAVAATGRLSSEAPNLQNIPIRTEEGRRIREAFVPAEGKLLVSADYSQIELRILAHLSGDERMRQGFVDGADIHRRTASEMLGVPEAEVTFEQRSMAKAINFGILYGMSAFRLAREQDLSQDEAKEYIAAYYGRYPKIREWKRALLAQGKANGFVETLFGRVRNVADLRSRSPIARRAAERVAVNTPVQGSAADIIKAAMVSVDARLARELPSAKMVLQVHDELVFEVPADDADALVALAVEEMTGVMALSVPLIVNAAKGHTWLEAH